MSLVSEIVRRDRSRPFVIARFVLNETGSVDAVEVAPRGLVLVKEAVGKGVPDPAGAGLLTRADGRRFLAALSDSYRKARLVATAPFQMNDQAARAGRDEAARPPVIALSETFPRARPLYELAGRSRITIGDGPDCDMCLTPIREHSGVYTVLTWEAGWLWVEPGPSPSAGVLDGLVLKAMTPGNRAPVDPGATLVYGNRTFQLDYSVPSATPGAAS
jgi:hypothetical protein